MLCSKKRHISSLNHPYAFPSSRPQLAHEHTSPIFQGTHGGKDHPK